MNLQTTYMGMPLKSPLVASASPLSASVDNIRRMEDAGAAAVVMFSLFEEQLRHEAEAIEHLMEYGVDSFTEASGFFPSKNIEYSIDAGQYLDILHEASQKVSIPVIGSLNGVSNEGWVDYARRMEKAGASAIELNIYNIPADIYTAGMVMEQQYLDVLKAVKRAVSVPVALKISPYFSSTGNACHMFAEAGANALVLFNRFYQPDFDLEALDVVHNLKLSESHDIRLPLMWIAILFGRVNASLAATGGVQTAIDMVKYLMAGADVVMTTSAILKHGIEHLTTLLAGLEDWMDRHEYESVDEMRGAMSQSRVADPGAFERANYIKVLESYKSQFLAR